MSQDISTDFGLWIFKTHKPIKEQLLAFPFDNDWTENEDYFQDDTLELGYDSEADRLVTEYLSKNKVTSHSGFKAWIKHFITNVFDTDSYYHEYQFETIKLSDSEIVISYYYNSGS